MVVSNIWYEFRVVKNRITYQSPFYIPYACIKISWVGGWWEDMGKFYVKIKCSPLDKGTLNSLFKLTRQRFSFLILPFLSYFDLV